MGGYVLFEILKSAPRYISAVGLVSTRPGADNEEGRKNRQKMIDQVDRDGVEAIAAQMVPKLLGATTQRDRPDLATARAKPDRCEHAGPREGGRRRDDGAQGLDTAAREDRRAGARHAWRRRCVDSAQRGRGNAPRHRNSQLELIPLSGHLPNLEQPVPFDAAALAIPEEVMNKILAAAAVVSRDGRRDRPELRAVTRPRSAPCAVRRAAR